MSNNINLSNANKIKNDEFYTKYEDIENEIQYYKKHFENKIIYCNCDNPEKSNFWKYFKDNFKKLKLKQLISTHYIKDKKSYKLEFDGITFIKTKLKGNGDFRSNECIEILKEVDVIVTNPPFSLFREYIDQLNNYNKKFLIVGNQNSITYKNVFPLLKDDKVWIGYNHIKEFIKQDGSIQKFGNICWFTNLDINKKYDLIPLTRKYNSKDYPKYDNYNAINVGKISEIPCDYYEPMGVPISFMDKYNPNQFEILGNLGSYGVDGYSLASAIYINNKKVFKRILIKRVCD